jgi:cell division protease FtsH
MPLPDRDDMFATKAEIEQDIMVTLGGRIAEELIFGDVTTGASNDIKKATKAARNMVVRYGMSELGMINYEEGDEDEVFIGRDLAHTRSFSDTKAAEIDAQVKMIIDRCYAEARKILEEHMDVLHAGAELLIEKERINREEFEALFEG